MARRRSWGSGWGGCALWALAFVFVIVGGCTAGLALRPDPNAPATVATAGRWKLQVRKDADGAPCVELFVSGELRTAQCAFTSGARTDPSDPTSPPAYQTTSIKIDGDWVIFGPVPDTVAKVRLRLADRTRPVVAVDEKKGVRYFVLAGKVADQGPTELLAADGTTIELP